MWGLLVGLMVLLGVLLLSPPLHLLQLRLGAVEFLFKLAIARPDGFFFRPIFHNPGILHSIGSVSIICSPSSRLSALLDQLRRDLANPLRAPRPLLKYPQPIHLPLLPLSSLQNHIFRRNLHLLAPRQLEPEVLQPAPIQYRHCVSLLPLFTHRRGQRTDEQRAFDAAFLPCRVGGVEGVEHGVGREGEDAGCGGVVPAEDEEVELGIGARGECGWGVEGRLGVGGVGDVVAVVGFVSMEGFGGGALGDGGV